MGKQNTTMHLGLYVSFIVRQSGFMPWDIYLLTLAVLTGILDDKTSAPDMILRAVVQSHAILAPCGGMYAHELEIGANL